MDESASPIQMPDRAKVLKTALFLQQLGSHERAIDSLSKLLTAEPYNVKALRAIVVSFQAIGEHERARAALERLHATMPDDTEICVEIAESYQKTNDHENAYKYIQSALAIDPNSTAAHEAMVQTLNHIGRPAEALKHRQRRAPMVPIVSRPALLDTFDEPIRVLVLASGDTDHPTITRALRRHDLQMIVLHIETLSINAMLPEYDVFFSTVAFDTRYRAVLMHLEEIVARKMLPIVNRPASVLATDPSILAWRLAPIEGLTIARIVRVDRGLLESADCTAVLAEKRLHFPLLIRAVDARNSRREHMSSIDDLGAFLARSQASQFECSQFLDLRCADGRIRCYRVALIDDAWYPLAFASAYHWRVDLNGTDTSSESTQEEELQFFADHVASMGSHVLQQLRVIAHCIEIDTCVIDFSLNDDRALTLLGIDASCDWADPPEGETFAMRRRASDRARQAIVELLLERTPHAAEKEK